MLFAYTDNDIDGIDDKMDKCPNTPFYELVDSSGCSISSLESDHKFDFIYGISFAQSNYIDGTSNVTSQNFQFDYYYKDFSLELSTSYSTSSWENSLGDSYLGVNYQFSALKNLKIKTGIGLILPTYNTELNNNNTDYTAMISASYAFEKFNIFAGYNFTKINDDDIVTVDITANYQDTNSYSAGFGFYPTQDSYLSASYFSGDNIYVGDDTIDTISIYGFYSLSEQWFTTINYAHGLSDSASDNYLSLKVGYNF
jgi:hypothetical protein